MRYLQYKPILSTPLDPTTALESKKPFPGAPISDTAFELGYFDLAHLTNSLKRSLKRFIGKTPAQIARKSTAR